MYNQLLYPARQIQHIGQRYDRGERERGKRRKFITTLQDDCRPVPGPSRSGGRGTEIPLTAPPPADVATPPSPPWTHALWQTTPTTMDGGNIRRMCAQKPSPLTTPPSHHHSHPFPSVLTRAKLLTSTGNFLNEAASISAESSSADCCFRARS